MVLVCSHRGFWWPNTLGFCPWVVGFMLGYATGPLFGPPEGPKRGV